MTIVSNSNGIWLPPEVGFLSAGWMLSIFIGIGGLLLMPKLPKLIPEFIFQIKPSPFGKAIGESFTAVGATLGRPVKGGARLGVNQAGEYIGTNRGGKGAWTKKTSGEKAATAFGKITEFFNKK